jgi:DNA-binding transcriptional regulator LsrR (DeoR family)
MAQERLTMRKVREILRLYYDRKLSQRAVARSCRVSHSTMKEYVERA